MLQTGQIRQMVSCVENTCPTLADYYRLLQNEGKKKTSGQGRKSWVKYCPYCQKPFKPDSFQTRLIQKPKLTPRLQKLVTRYSDDPGKLGKFQRNLVEHYIEGQNKLVTSCLTCKNKVKLKGQTRLERQRQKPQTVKQQTLETQQIEEKPLTAKEVKKKRKKEKRKRKDKDLSAGLTLPDVPLAGDSGPDKKSLELEEDPIDTSEYKTDKNTEPKPSVSSASHGIASEKTSPPKVSKVTKRKASAIDLDSVIAKKKAGKAGGPSSMLSGVSLTKGQKKKQLGQKLGLILKQEKKKGPTGGSLADFLSSL